MTRSRSSTENGFPATVTHTGTVSLRAPVTVNSYDITHTFVDVVVEDFHARLKRGEVINNPCSNVKVSTLRSLGGSYNQTSNTNPAFKNNMSGGGSLTQFARTRLGACSLKTISNGNVTDMTTSATSSALADVDKAPYSIAEDLATIKQTISFLRVPFNSLLQVISRWILARKRILASRFSAAKTARLLSNLWLEFRFAFMPLVRSAYTVLQSLADKSSRQVDKVQVAHGKASSTAKAKDDVNVSNLTYSRTVESEITIYATVQYRVSSPLREWQYKYGLRVKDIPELIWDLFPYSFMIDRLIDIGDAIRGLTNFSDPSVRILGGCISNETITTQSISWSKTTSPAGYTHTLSSDVDIFKTESYVRTVWQPSVLNTIPPVFPGGLFKDISSIVDLLALVLQRLK